MTEKNTNKVLRPVFFLAGLFAILFITSLLPALYFYKDMGVKVYNLVVRSLLIGIIPVLFLPLIYWISIQKPILKNWQNLLLHVFLSILFCFAFLLIFQISIFFILGGENFLSLNFESMTAILTRQFFFIGSILFFTYWGIVVLFGLKKYYEELGEIRRRSNEIQIQLEQATLSSLQAQLKPHFLFNTLSMVDQMIAKNPAEAAEMVDKLERLLRNTFDRNNPETCTIKEEIEFLKKYLSIEESRFSDRLTVRYSISKAAQQVKIPRYLLQPLVENAIVHGVSKTMNRCEISITAEFSDDQLILSVENDIPNPGSNRKAKSKGIGLDNVKKRIALYFGEEAGLKIETVDSKKFISKISIPRKYLKMRSTVSIV